MIYLFLLLIVLAPLPLGGTLPIAWSMMAFLTGALIIIYCMRKLVGKEDLPVAWNKIQWPSICLALVCLWAFIQSTSVTPTNWHHPLWYETTATLGSDIDRAISINPFETIAALLRLATYGGIFWLAMQLGRDTAKATIFLHTLATTTAVYAAYGLIVHLTGSSTILWYEKTAHIDSVTATFLDRDTFATFAGIGALATLVALIRNLKLTDQAEMTAKAGIKMNFLAGNRNAIVNLLLVVALFITSAAIILSNSPTALVSFLAALCVLTASLLFRNREVVLVATILAAAGYCAFLWLYIANADTVGLHHNAAERFVVHRLTLAAIADSQWLGTGYGTFADIFPMYRDQSIDPVGVWQTAQNTYLETILELGLPAAVILFASIGTVVWGCLQGISRRRRDPFFAMLGYAVSVLVGIHALAASSIQIPGLAVIFAAVLGFCFAQSWPPGAQPQR